MVRVVLNLFSCTVSISREIVQSLTRIFLLLCRSNECFIMDWSVELRLI